VIEFLIEYGSYIFGFIIGVVSTGWYMNDSQAVWEGDDD
jgi:hypothetical protein